MLYTPAFKVLKPDFPNLSAYDKFLALLAPTQCARVITVSPTFRARVWLLETTLPISMAEIGEFRS